MTAATVSFGHGLAASPLHLAAAYATLANDGQKVTPTLVHGKKRPAGERVVSEQAARLAITMLREVVVRGTARAGNVEGYAVAGKTGTADKPRPGGGYYDNKVVANFASIFPYDDPKYVLVVTLDEPTGQLGGGESRVAGATAVPVAADVISRLAPILGLRPVGAKPLPDIEAPPKAGVKVAANQ